jgi:hypothetical protein
MAQAYLRRITRKPRQPSPTQRGGFIDEGSKAGGRGVQGVVGHMLCFTFFSRGSAQPREHDVIPSGTKDPPQSSGDITVQVPGANVYVVQDEKGVQFPEMAQPAQRQHKPLAVSCRHMRGTDSKCRRLVVIGTCWKLRKILPRREALRPQGWKV